MSAADDRGVTPEQESPRLAASALASAEDLLDEFYAAEPATMERRETITEICSALLLAALATVLVVLAPRQGVADPSAWPLFALAYAAAASVRFHVGATYTVPTQLILVPMLLLLPAGAVAPLVVAGLVLSSLPDTLRGRTPPRFLLCAVSDGWHALGAAAVFAVAGPGHWGVTAVGLYIASFVAQAVTDSVTIVLRQWIGRGIRPDRQQGVVGIIQGVDALLWPLGYLAAAAAHDGDLAWMLILFAPVGLAVLAHDRGVRIEQAHRRLEALRAERSRKDQAIRRIGEAFGTTLDREALLELTLHTAIDAAGADGGRVVRGAVTTASHRLDDADAREAVLAAERAAGAEGRTATATVGAWHAVACPIQAGGESVRALAVARRGSAFAADERDIAAYLAGQAALSVQNIELHERLREQALTDALTGLSNHRRFRERLDQELADARRHHHEIALVLLDLDDFKAINDAHGHLIGDRVLQRVAEILIACSRPVDEAARYGGEELAILLPRTSAGEALTVAERVRGRIAAATVTTPGGLELPVTASFGIAVSDGNGDGSSLIARADRALYAAKAAGKNRALVDGADERPASSASSC